MKRILVPTDFSSQAENALKVAAQLANRFDGEIFLLHMLELPLQLIDPVSGSGTKNLPEALFFMKLAKKKFKKLIDAPYLKGIKIHDIVEFHKAFDGIMEVSKEHNCDFIVMGSNGSSGIKEVLVIKNEHENFDINNFVFATDFDLEQKQTLSKAIQFANKINAHLHLVYINTANNFKTTQEINQCLEDFTEGQDLSQHSIIVYNDINVEEGVLNFAKSINAGLIGISTHGRKGLAHFFNGSISEDLVNHANRPVVTFKI